MHVRDVLVTSLLGSEPKGAYCAAFKPKLPQPQQLGRRDGATRGLKTGLKEALLEALSHVCFGPDPALAGAVWRVGSRLTGRFLHQRYLVRGLGAFLEWLQAAMTVKEEA